MSPSPTGMSDKLPVLIIGGGGGGLFLAARLSEHMPVIMLSKYNHPKSNTALAQGGIAFSSGNTAEQESHLKDTQAAGHNRCNAEALQDMIEHSESIVSLLAQWGVSFTKKDNQLDTIREGGHSRERIAHANDSTGKALMEVLLERVRRSPNVRILENHTALSLIIDDSGACTGAEAYDAVHKQTVSIYARHTVLCTGGSGQLFSRTTNAEGSTGDGIALAVEAGARISDMEFYQFHPTTFCGKDNSGYGDFLLTEALRGAGAVILNAEKQRFMHLIHPMGDLAPRDIVARTMKAEMERSATRHLWLDARSIAQETLKTQFNGAWERCRQAGYSLADDLIPIAPAAHYQCGGIHTDLNGNTTVKGLSACGEAARTGVHGANRLASNSLLETFHFAGKTADHLLLTCKGPSPNYYDEQTNSCCIKPSAYEKRPPLSPEIRKNIAACRRFLQNCMWRHASLVKSHNSLTTALRVCRKIENLAGHWFITYAPDVELIELRSLAISGRICTEASLKREISIGTHYRSDKPRKRLSAGLSSFQQK